MKKEMTYEPFIERMTLEEGSWILIDAQSTEETKVVFFNPKQDPEINTEDALTFKNFAEYYFDENFQHSIRDGANMDFKENIAYAAGAKATQDEDYDEDSHRSFKIWVADAQVINVYKDLKLENIPEMIKKTEKEVEEVEKEEIEAAQDNADFQKDPYAYYGVRRSDFF